VWRRLRGPTLEVLVATHPPEIVAGTHITVSFTVNHTVPRSTITAAFLAESRRTTHPRRVRIARRSIALHKRTIEVEVPKISRGLYAAESVAVESFDPLGLSRVRYSGSSNEETFRVVPAVLGTQSIPSTVGTTVRNRTNEVALQRSDELIEARAYHPGDDPYRIHWGMLAHTNEIFLRIGDELPPPSEDLAVALDLTGAVSMEQIDSMTGIVLGICESMERYRSIRIALFDPEICWYGSIESARWDWARLEPSCSGNSVELPSRGSETSIAVIVTGGASSIAPSTWDDEAVGIVTIREDGHYDAFATVG
jgi:hypothetical protein